MNTKDKALNIIFSNTITVNGVEHETIPSERMVLAYILLEMSLPNCTPMQAKLPEIAYGVGIEAKAVGRAVRKLIEMGAVEAVKKKAGWCYLGVNVQ